MKTLILLSLISFPILGWSQSSHKHSLRVSSYLIIQPDVNSIFLGNVKPAYTITGSKGLENQFELTSLQFGKRTQPIFDPNPPITILGDGVNSYAALGIRHIFSVPLANAENKTLPYIGVSNLVNGFLNRTQPNVSTVFESRSSAITGQLGIVPSVKHFLSDRLYVDLGIIMDFFEWEVSNFRTENPAFPVDQRSFTQSRTEFYFFRRIHARMGVGVTF